MKVKFQQLFTDKVQQIGYWGNSEDLHIWIETASTTEKKWFNYSFQKNQITEIPYPFDFKNQYNFIQAAGKIAYFSELLQGKNPVVNQVLAIDLSNGKTSQQVMKLEKTFEINTPNHYAEGQEYFKEFQEFFEKKFKEKIGKGIDYYEGEDQLVFSYYIYKNAWVNILKVCNSSFDILWKDQLDENDLIGKITFQIVANHLIYIKNKHQLIVLAHE